MHGKKFESHNMTVLYPNQYYNKVCYKKTTLYKGESSKFKNPKN